MSTNQTVRDVVLKHIAINSGYSVEAVAEDTSSKLTALGMDEIDIVTAMMEIEDELGIALLPNVTDMARTLAVTVQVVIDGAQVAKGWA